MDRIRVLSVALVAVLASAPAHARAPRAGERAPDGRARGSDGRTHSLAKYRGRVIVLEWFNKDCPFVRKFYDAGRMQAWQGEATAGPKPVAWLTIISSARGKQGFLSEEEASRVRADVGMRSTALLLDPRGEVARRYGATSTPHVFIIDPKGRLAYRGAVDDRPSARPESLEGADSYFARALANVQAGTTPEPRSTVPYGCPIKF